ncbi:orotidine-5'-phosphate decarboxylase [Gracilinema caldarium]|uniref:orotidine-5'-phosphate decarboxylase n=1 Tax=Gracilinema caldarium TaxID=215591 RepID=UPI0026ED6D4C|nr:orotidine-5'-phosphate decarboxylase [Gracilinema caldarium]
MKYAMDALFEAVRDRGPVCVGLDTAPDYIPPRELKHATSKARAVLDFNRAIIDATQDVSACYKVQIAYYEALGLAGLEAYRDTLAYIRQRGSLVIADIKRGDIADTAKCYAKAHYEGDFEADLVTLSPYMGMDSIEPWFSYAKEQGKGAFVLMRTSNRGMKDFEYQELAKGGRLYHEVGRKIQALAHECRGSSGFGAFGVVVGCTEPEEAEQIRREYRDLFFLIPGYGAQGGAAEDASRLLIDGNGGVVNASRSILKAWFADFNTHNILEATYADVAVAARRETLAMKTDILAACAASRGWEEASRG